MSAFKAGLLTLVVLVVAAYFGFTKSNPFTDPYELNAVVRDAQNLKTGAPVRIAGVEVGKVTKVEAADADEPAAQVTMQLREDALPVHEDATVQIRPRILLEGNFFVDIDPGSPSAADFEDGETVPITQTSTAVTLPDVLSVLAVRHPHRPPDPAARARHRGARRRRRAGAQPRDQVVRAGLPAERADQRRAARRAAQARRATAAARAAARVRHARREPRGAAASW